MVVAVVLSAGAAGGGEPDNRCDDLAQDDEVEIEVDVGDEVLRCGKTSLDVVPRIHVPFPSFATSIPVFLVAQTDIIHVYIPTSWCHGTQSNEPSSRCIVFMYGPVSLR
nr:hypothetical protein CFP56_31771 [Quercus suber]